MFETSLSGIRPESYDIFSLDKIGWMGFFGGVDGGYGETPLCIFFAEAIGKVWGYMVMVGI